MKVHSEERPYKCNQCDYAGKHLRNLTTHIGKHEGIVYGCDQCTYKTSQKSNLKMHVESKHTGIVYACDQCRYKASLKGRLKIHVESKHKGILYSCNQRDFKTGQVLCVIFIISDGEVAVGLCLLGYRIPTNTLIFFYKKVFYKKVRLKSLKI